MSTELARLSDYETRAEEAVKQVNRGMEAFAVELKAIKDLGLWKGAYDSFEDYCNLRWGRTVRTVQRALKAHTTRQKLLAAASSAEKPVIEAASTRKIEESAKAPEDQQMAHLTIGRNKPTATRVVDFYSSPKGESVSVKEIVDHANAVVQEAIKPVSMTDQERADRHGTARVLRTYPLKDESHRPYLLQLAGCIERGEPA